MENLLPEKCGFGVPSGPGIAAQIEASKCAVPGAVAYFAAEALPPCPVLATEVPPELFEEMQVIAQRVGGDFSMQVKLGQPGHGSYFNPTSLTITLDPLQVMANPALAKFIPAHEGGHRAITLSPYQLGLKLEDIMELYNRVGFGFTQNVFEDCCVNTWVPQSYEGLEGLFKDVYRDQFSRHFSPMVTAEIAAIAQRLGFWPKFAEYGTEVLRAWYQRMHGADAALDEGGVDRKMDPSVRDALSRTKALLPKIFDMLPPPGCRNEAQVLHAGRGRFREIAEAVWPEVQQLVELDIGTEAQRQLINEYQRLKAREAWLREELKAAEKNKDSQTAAALKRGLQQLQGELDAYKDIADKTWAEIQRKIDEGLRRESEKLAREIQHQSQEILAAQEEQAQAEEQLRGLQQGQGANGDADEGTQAECQAQRKRQQELREEAARMALSDSLDYALNPLGSPSSGRLAPPQRRSQEETPVAEGEQDAEAQAGGAGAEGQAGGTDGGEGPASAASGGSSGGMPSLGANGGTASQQNASGEGQSGGKAPATTSSGANAGGQPGGAAGQLAGGSQTGPGARGAGQERAANEEWQQGGQGVGQPSFSEIPFSPAERLVELKASLESRIGLDLQDDFAETQGLAALTETLHQQLRALREAQQQMPLPLDELSPEARRQLEKALRNLPPDRLKQLLEKAKRSMEDFEDALNDAMRGQLNAEHAPSHRDLRADSEARERATALQEMEKYLQDQHRQQRQLQRLRDAEKSEYDRGFEEMSDLIDETYNYLKRFFLAAQEPEWEQNLDSGLRVNLDMAMQGEADPAYLTRVFERREIHSERSDAFEIWVDVSGSMQEGNKCEQTFLASIFLAELFERLKTRYEIHAFSDTPMLLKVWEDSIKEVSVREMLSRLKLPGGGTNDATALSLGYRRIKELSVRNKFLFIICDTGSGYPRELKAVLGRIKAERQVVVVHFGLGHGTADVQHFYPYSFGNLKIGRGTSDDPNSFTSVLRRVVPDMLMHPEEWQRYLREQRFS